MTEYRKRGLRERLEPLRSGFLFGAVVGAMAGGIDVLHSVVAGQREGALGLIAYTLALSITACAWLFADFGVAVAISNELARRSSHRGARLLRVVLLAVPLIAFAWWVPTSWVVEHWEELSGKQRALVGGVYLFLALSGLVATRVGIAIAERASAAERPPRYLYPLAAVAALGALVCYAADRFVLPDLYADFHAGLSGAFVLALAGALGLVLLRRRAGRRLQSGALIAAIAAHVALVGLAVSAFKVPEPRTSLLFTKLLSGSRSATDFDRDGASSFFGGADCAGFDPELGPKRFDLPEDGRDQDCTGSDARWPEPPGERDYAIPDLRGYNVLVISIDALRARNLSSYGYPRPTSPAIDALAARSLRFARAFSQSTKTFESLPSLFTGLYPTNLPRVYGHKRLKGKRYLFYLGPEVETIPEMFRARDYRTAGFVSFRSLGRQGLDRGFSTFRATPLMTKLAIEFMQKDSKKPFFIWLHYGYPHAPYAPKGKPIFGTSVMDRYDGEIRRADDAVGELMRFLDSSKLEEKTIVVLTADHGEEFQEHGGKFHAPKLYSELLHVPLIVHVPGVAPRVIDGITELVGVAPALCELVRLNAECDGFDGESLLSQLEGRRAKQPLSAYSEIELPDVGLVRRSLFTDDYRIIDDIEKGRTELYELRSDPGEQRDRSRELDSVVRSLREELLRRPFVRQADVFREYRAKPDVERLARNLRVVRNDELLLAALDIIARSDARDARAVKKSLAELRKRSGLNPKVRRALDRLGG